MTRAPAVFHSSPVVRLMKQKASSSNSFLTSFRVVFFLFSLSLSLSLCVHLGSSFWNTGSLICVSKMRLLVFGCFFLNPHRLWIVLDYNESKLVHIDVVELRPTGRTRWTCWNGQSEWRQVERPRSSWSRQLWSSQSDQPSCDLEAGREN